MDIKNYSLTFLCNKCEYNTWFASWGDDHNIDELLPYTRSSRECPNCKGVVTMSKASFTAVNAVQEKPVNKELVWAFTSKCLRCCKNWTVRVSLFNSEEYIPNRPTAICPKCGEMEHILYFSVRREN